MTTRHRFTLSLWEFWSAVHSKGTRPLILAAALLAGCGTVNAGPFAGAGGEATWLKRETGEMRHCVQARPGLLEGVSMGAAWNISGAASAYARCKSQLEAAGFERMQ